MANKITLGKPPKNFQRSVLFTTVEGDESFITWTFIYRTRKQFGELVDTNAPDDVAPSEGIPTMQSMMEKANVKSADYIMQIAEGWDLSADFNRVNVQELCDQYPAAVNAAVNAYREAVMEGRLGN